MSLLRRLAAGAILVRSNTVPFERPDRLPRALLALAPWGASLAGGAAAAAARYPNRPAVIDDDGAITYRRLWADAQALAGGLVTQGVGPDVRVGLLCRNHRSFVTWLVAIAASGADVVLLNTGFAGPQLADVVESERLGLVVHDDDFSEVVAQCRVRRIDGMGARALVASRGTVRPSTSQGSIVVLTSGTTGQPKGAARRSDSGAIEGAAAIFERIPLRLGDTQVISAPLFHSWGLSALLMGITRCTTNVLSRRFDPAATLHAVTAHHADVLFLVPVMLARILSLPDAVLDAADTASLRVIASSGSALGAKLATDALSRFGPVLYNLYGSTEVAVATIATPSDLSVAPSTAGRAAFAVTVGVLDAAGEPVPSGETGRIFVGGALRFNGYTDGGSKEERRGMLSSGDLGHLRDGLLFVEGREDDMIVSGGENVFPAEIEELLRDHPDIVDVAVVGVPDDEFGQALAAFVVRRPGSRLRADDVRAVVRAELARFKVPRRVEFVTELPRNAMGKVMRRELSAR